MKSLTSLRVPASLLAAGLLAVACGPSDSDDGTAQSGGGLSTVSTAGAAVPAPAAPVGNPDELRTRATELWQARVEENWTTAFEFEDTRDYPDLTVEDFITWSTEQEPFRYKGFEFARILTEADLGWVEVISSTAMRRFPKMPPRETTRWEKWRLVEGVWKLVPRERLEEFPDSPALRDVEAESALAARFTLSWKARNTKNWDALYRMLDPEDRADDPEKPPFLPLDFIEHDVHWIQAVGAAGIVRVEFLQKIDDPSLTKLQPNRVVKNERWIRRDGEWYLDLTTPE